jgi:hypothetical protein
MLTMLSNLPWANEGTAFHSDKICAGSNLIMLWSALQKTPS